MATRRGRKPPPPPGGSAVVHDFPTPTQPPPQRRRAQVLAIGNEKGGVGKTTVTLGLAEAAAAAGLSVGVVDLDPQGDLTSVLHPQAEVLLGGGEHPSIESCLMIGGRTLSEVMQPSVWDGVQIVGASRQLSGMDPYLAAAEKTNPTVRLRLRQQVLQLDVDLVLIDLQRSLSLSSSVGVLASDGVLGVTELSTFSGRALQNMVNTVRSLSGAHDNVRMVGVVANLATSTREASRVAEGLAADWGDRLWQPFIPSRAVIRESYTAYRSKLRDFGTPASREVAAIFDRYLSTARAALTESITQQQGAQ